MEQLPHTGFDLIHRRGAHGPTRTGNRELSRYLLYPVELRALLQPKGPGSPNFPVLSVSPARRRSTVGRWVALRAPAFQWRGAPCRQLFQRQHRLTAADRSEPLPAERRPSHPQVHSPQFSLPGVHSIRRKILASPTDPFARAWAVVRVPIARMASCAESLQVNPLDKPALSGSGKVYRIAGATHLTHELVIEPRGLGCRCASRRPVALPLVPELRTEHAALSIVVELRQSHAGCPRRASRRG